MLSAWRNLRLVETVFRLVRLWIDNRRQQTRFKIKHRQSRRNRDDSFVASFNNGKPADRIGQVPAIQNLAVVTTAKQTRLANVDPKKMFGRVVPKRTFANLSIEFPNFHDKPLDCTLYIIHN
ncbi:hypothetical protein AX760_24260 [Pararhizobium antarcticum]|uniref:Uncharacterized protein n=1 Tax=Pararhizobium antarcticum TaxID=1798805 RepID=A0A657LMB5_9HYPH|nr:hypothetical protein AX760_24260 [Pararhizobium antarcticum]